MRSRPVAARASRNASIAAYVPEAVKRTCSTLSSSGAVAGTVTSCTGAGGDGGNRTHDQGFADPCLTTWLRRLGRYCAGRNGVAGPGAAARERGAFKLGRNSARHTVVSTDAHEGSGRLVLRQTVAPRSARRLDGQKPLTPPVETRSGSDQVSPD